jgi:hypothetical protein
VLACSVGASPAPAATLKADYQLAGTRASSCCGAPALIDLGANSFVDEVVDGARQPVLAFPLSSGVAIPSGVIPLDSYSIEALFRFDTIDGYKRIYDLSSATADRGLYELNGQLYYWPVAGGNITPPPFAPNRYTRVVLTRDAATGTVAAYADGAPQLTFPDTGGQAVFTAGSAVRFFKDDTIIPGEESAGAVARIRVYDGALTAAEVAGLSRRTIADLPPPRIGREVNVQATSGRVLVAIPSRSTTAQARASQKGLRFVPLEEARQIPTGSFLDTRKGTVELRSATGAGVRTQSAKFSAGLFQVLQSRRRKAKGLTELRLKGSSFRSCRRGGKRSSAGAARLSRRTIRRLRARGKGRFRSRGRYSAATVRGTVWITADRCDGTLTTVKRGKVAVRDFRRRKTVTVRAGRSYLARAQR